MVAAVVPTLAVHGSAPGQAGDPRAHLTVSNRGHAVEATTGSFCLDHPVSNGHEVMGGVCGDAGYPLPTRGAVPVRAGDHVTVSLGAAATTVSVLEYGVGWRGADRPARNPSPDRRRWTIRYTHGAARHCGSRLQISVRPAGGGDVSFEATVRAQGCGPDLAGAWQPSPKHRIAAKDRAALLFLMTRARSALLAADAPGVCGLLTPYGRRRVLEFRVDYDHEGAIRAGDPRLPQTCTAMVAREYHDAIGPNSGVSWPRDLRRSRFSVKSVEGRWAQVELKVPGRYGPIVGFTAKRTLRGWRVEDSDVVPYGH
jgi:hypothetical protein